jgi:hypothetical protein
LEAASPAIDSGLVVLKRGEHLLRQPDHRAFPLLRAFAGKSELDFQERRTNPGRIYSHDHPSGVVKAFDFPRAAEIAKERVDVVDCRLYFNFHFVPVLMLATVAKPSVSRTVFSWGAPTSELSCRSKSDPVATPLSPGRPGMANDLGG